MTFPSSLVLSDATYPVLGNHIDSHISLASVKTIPTTSVYKTRFVVDSTSDIPVTLQHIAYCESGGQQFDATGAVIRGRVNHNDIGKYQVNLDAWGAEAQRLGYDIFTEAGNEAMALVIYNRIGAKAWYPSQSCWEQ